MTDKIDMDKNRITTSLLRETAEEKLSKSPDDRTPELKDKTSEEIIHELRVHQVELEMQNEELKRVQLESEESKKKYQDLYDLAPVGYFTLTRKGIIKGVNLTGAALLGVSRSQLINLGFGYFVIPESLEQWDQHIITVIGHEEAKTCDLRLKREDGSIFYARLRSIRMDAPPELNQMSDGSHVISIVITDITELKRIEDTLVKSERFLSNVFASIPDGISVLDKQMNIVMVNQTMESWYAHALPFTGKKCFEVYHDASQPCQICPSIQTLKTGKSAVEVVPMMGKGGIRVGWNELYSFPLTDAATGKTTGVIEFVRDISEKKQAEDSLRESELRFHTLFETANDAIFLMDHEKFIECNTKTLQMFGCEDKKDMVGHTPFSFSPEKQPDGLDSTDKALKYINAALNSNPQTFYWKHCRKDGSPFDVEVSLNAIVMGDKTNLQAIVRDISERMRTEELLESTNAYHRTLLQTSVDPFVTISPDGKISDVNTAAEEVTGYSREDLIGTSFSDYFTEPDKAIAGYQQVFDFGVVKDYELGVQRRDGHVIPVVVSASVYRNKYGEVIGVFAAARDITERRRLETQRLDMQRKLLHAQKLESLGVMAGGIAHDFNNLLQVILGNLDLALTDLPTDSKARQSILNAIQASERSAELSRQMLTYSGSSFYLPQNIHLNELLNTNLDLLKMCVSNKIVIKIEMAATLPLIKGDADQIQRVITNLLTNASEAIGDKEGDVCLSIGVLDCDETLLSRSRLEIKPEPGRFIFLEVKDTGCGMDEQTLNRVFEPFFSTKFWGRGLGMAEVMGTVKGHHGAIIVDSELGKGTAIRVLLPVSEKAQTSSVTDREVVEPKEPASDNVTGRKTILVVDDEELVRGLCIEWLELLGYDTIAAVDGVEGVRIFRERLNEIDMVLLDFVMPRINGIEAFEELIRIKPDVKVIFSSGYAKDLIRQRFPGCQPASILHKPYDMDILKAELERLLGTAD
jgi:two-component system cell cycle sensor histidine kinase/response regulator CckA